MKLLISSHGANLYGAERVLVALAHGLAAAGHDVSVEVPHDGPLVSRLERLDGVRTIVTRRARLPRTAFELARYVLSAPLTVVRLARSVRRGGYDVVWVNSLYNPLVGIAARIAGVPVVWHLHERNLPGAAGWAMSRVIDLCATTAAAISDFVAGTYPLRRTRIARLDNALLQPIAPGRIGANRQFTVGYVGQFEPRKRAPDVLRAAARLPSAHVLLVGDGKARNAVELAAADPRLEGRVHFAGFQHHTTTWFKKFDCLVIPSRDEPFGLVALEGMAAGLPVVAAASGALPEVLGDAALFYPPGDHDALAEHLTALSTRPGLVREMRDRSRERIQHFTLDRFIREADSILRETALAGR